VSLINEVLEGVSDTRLLTDHKQGPSPLQSLITDYNDKASHNDNAPTLTSLSTGLDLKEGISKLDVEEQVCLLYKYLVDSKRIVHAEEPPEHEERKLKSLGLRVAIYSLSVITIMLFGAFAAIAVKSNTIPNSDLLATFLETVGEFADVIWGK
jgi:hypothetical protein